MSNICHVQSLGIDLIQAAKNELEFLKLVDDYPTLSKGPVVKNAIRRYELFWLPFATRFGLSPTLQAAPLDIAWVWHVHMLAPFYYEQDCLNIVSTVLDHAPLNSTQRNLSLQSTRDRWRKTYPEEPFEVDLAKPPTVLRVYRSRIQYNLEEACHRQFKFYYQVSLPHYRDDFFLRGAVKRYEHHLLLKRLHPDVFMVPCYDFDLIWHAHQLHPLNYTQATKAWLGKPLHHDDSATGRTPGSKLYDAEMKTRSTWETAGLCFPKAGAMYRGDPPDPRLPTPTSLYAPLALSEYVCEIRRIQASNLNSRKNFVLRVESKIGKVLFSQNLKGSFPVLPQKFKFDNQSKHIINILLFKKKLFGKKLIAGSQLDLLPYFEAVPFDYTARDLQITIDVPLNGGQYTAKLTIDIDQPPSIIKYCFDIQPEVHFTPGDHPSKILSCPQLMLSPKDLAKSHLACDYSIHPVLDWRGNRVFSCRVLHSSDAPLSAVEIINASSNVVASAHTLSPYTFPERIAVEDQRKNIFLNKDEGERAMLIRGDKDWAVCTGRLRIMNPANRGRGRWKQYFGGKKLRQQLYVSIKVYNLFGARGWCSVRKSKGGLFLIKFDSDTLVRIDLLKNRVVISPRAQNIPEILALASSISVLHLLCMPMPQSHPSSTIVSPSLYTAGYLSKKVPRSNYQSAMDLVEQVLDFSEDISSEWIQWENATSDNVSDGYDLDGEGGACVGTGDGTAGGCVGSEGGGGCVGGGDGGGDSGGGCGAGGDCGGGGCGSGCGGGGCGGD